MPTIEFRADAPLQKERLLRLWEWVREREKIRIAKEAGKPKPWTRNLTMRDVRWCNVRRMDDKVSRWLLDNWYPKTKVSRAQKLANAGMARLINWPDSLQHAIKAKLNKKWDKDLGLLCFRNVQKLQGKLFTGAYIINGIAGQDKITTVVNQFQSLYEQPELLNDYSMEETHTALQNVLGIGSFIAGQMVADLRYVHDGVWTDRHRWAPLGPGSRRGIAWLQGWDGIGDLPNLKQSDFETLLTLVIKEARKKVPKIIDDRKLEAHDFQNCLCEYDKYMRLLNNTGRIKNSYPGV